MDDHTKLMDRIRLLDRLYLDANKATQEWIDYQGDPKRKKKLYRRQRYKWSNFRKAQAQPF